MIWPKFGHKGNEIIKTGPCHVVELALLGTKPRIWWPYKPYMGTIRLSRCRATKIRHDKAKIWRNNQLIYGTLALQLGH